MILKGIIYDNPKILELRNNIGTLFDNKGIKFKSKLGEIQNTWKLAMGNVSSNLLSFYHEINESDPKWLEENLNKVDSKDFQRQFIEVSEKYPLLVNIGESIGSWTDMDNDNFAKNILDYVSLCDDQRDGDE
jgi:hypothetical protein